MAADFVASVAERAAELQAGLPGSGMDWLRQRRAGALQAFLRDGLPGRGDEPWKYTSLRAFARRPHEPGDADAATRAVDASALELPGVDGPCIVLVHGVFRPDLSRLDDCPEGLELVPLSRALQGRGELLKTVLDRDWGSRSDAFARLNAALAADGVVLRVAPGARVDVPVALVRIGLPGENSHAWHTRDIVEVGAGASLQLVEHYVGAGPCTHLATRIADLQVGESAELDWTIVQEAGEGEQLIRREQLRLAKSARVQLHAVELGGGLVRHALEATLAGDDARLETRGVFVPHGRQHIETRLDIRHEALGGYSDALWRGVADERGRGVLHGAIVVAPGADGTDASLSNKNLLLSRQAEIDSQPVLEIYADEVMAVHGATVGQLDEQALFYLRTRGVPLAEARTLLTAAFCRVALESMANEALREHCAERLRQRLPGAEAAGSASGSAR